MKLFVQRLAVFASMAVLLTGIFTSQPHTAIAANDRLPVCHKTSSGVNPWEAQLVDANQLQSHLDNGDFMYTGPVKDNGQPTSDGNTWCNDNAPTTPTPSTSPTVTVTPSIDPSPTATPSADPTATPSAEPTIVVTATPTPTATSNNDNNSNNNNNNNNSNNGSNTSTGSVLGASTSTVTAQKRGQVLGASTLAYTGNPLVSMGIMLEFVGLFIAGMSFKAYGKKTN